MALAVPPVASPTIDGTIERLEVEGGFLDGLDLGFASGLNTIVGARGTGKTSIIELIRFALDVRSMTEITASRAREHALGVLGDGRVTLTVVVGGDQFRIARSASDDHVDVEAALRKPLVLSQNEVEVVGADAAGRRRLLDAFVRSPSSASANEQAVLSRINSTSAQLQAVSRSLASLLEEQAQLANVEVELTKAEEEQTRLLQPGTADAADQKALAELDQATAEGSVRIAMLDRSRTSISGWRETLGAILANAPVLEPWSGSPKDDPLADLRSQLLNTVELVSKADSTLESAIDELGRRLEDAIRERENLAERARDVRRRLEAAAAGAGAVARKIADLRTKRSQLDSLRERVAQLTAEIENLQATRVKQLDELDGLRIKRFESRLTVASELTSALGPEIRVDVTRSGEFSDYAQTIIAALRGSQIHAAKSAPLISRAMSPREFVEAVELGDAETVANLSGLELERSKRIVDYLSGRQTHHILTAVVDDTVDFYLLDGGEPRHVSDVSTGQRCTVILSILMQQSDRVLVVDQPEDHLDNAFVAQTLVRSIRHRAGTRQLVVSTHNPNIPVLGEADRVIVLASDGRNGYVASAEPLDTPSSVEAITRLMEGGREAFQRRAEFYSLPAQGG